MRKSAVSACAAAVGLALVLVVLLTGAALAGPDGPTTSGVRRQAAGSTQWTSPWVAIPTDTLQVLHHNLGHDPDDYAVEMWFQDTDGDLGINRRNYGGMERAGKWTGAHWQHLNANTIRVYRQPHDRAADRVRVRIWIPAPDAVSYETAWLPIAQGETITLSHNLGITATDLTVGLWFRGTARGVHHFGYGGLAVDGLQRMLGAHWQNLTSNTVQVSRHPDDQQAQQVRIAVVHADPPDYDSLQDLGGWTSMTQTMPVVFTHGLDWDPSLLLLRAECRDLSGQHGIHQMFAGGNHDWFGGGNLRGFGLQNLTSRTVTVLRLDDDEFCSQVRVRVWRRTLTVYLPLVLRGA